MKVMFEKLWKCQYSKQNDALEENQPTVCDWIFLRLENNPPQTKTKLKAKIFNRYPYNVDQRQHNMNISICCQFYN